MPTDLAPRVTPVGRASARLWRPREAALSARDRTIVALTRGKLAGGRGDLREALRALREAVEEAIPAGRVFVLGRSGQETVVGSLISGVGLCEGEGGVRMMRRERDGRFSEIGPLRP